MCWRLRVTRVTAHTAVTPLPATPSLRFWVHLTDPSLQHVSPTQDAAKNTSTTQLRDEEPSRNTAKGPKRHLAKTSNDGHAHETMANVTSHWGACRDTSPRARHVGHSGTPQPQVSEGVQTPCVAGGERRTRARHTAGQCHPGSRPKNGKPVSETRVLGRTTANDEVTRPRGHWQIRVRKARPAQVFLPARRWRGRGLDRRGLVRGQGRHAFTRL